MFDRVDERFLDGQADAKDFPFPELVDLEEMLDLLLNPTCFGGVAGDKQIGGQALVCLRHKKRLAIKWIWSPTIGPPVRPDRLLCLGVCCSQRGKGRAPV